ncbi:hypothetical protein K2X05_01760 [bacterium]|nr:hypothetical protein [bacterium]
MSALTKIFFLVFVSFFYQLAFAGFHLEPYLGSSLIGQWKQGNSKDDVMMRNFGFKLGYQAPMGLQVGGDIQLGLGTYDNISPFDTNAAAAAFGAYLGYQSEMGLRAYAHYLFTSALVFDTTNDPVYKGNGFKLGVGYSTLPWLAINVEYHIMTYDKYKDNLISSTSLDPKHKDNFLFVTLSFPFNFGG